MTTLDLTQSLDSLQDRTRELSDAMHSFNREGLDRLSRALTQSIATGRPLVTRQDPDRIVHDELSKLVRLEAADGIKNLFARPDMRGGDGAISIVINNNAGVNVSAETTTGAFNQKYLEITIDQMVSNALVRGRQTTGLLGGLFGLSPGLSGR